MTSGAAPTPCAARSSAARGLAVTERPAEAIAGVGPGPAAGSVTLLDAAGAPWRATPFADDAAGRRELVDSLQALAVGHRLLDLSSGTGASSLGPVVDVQFGRVDTSGAAPTHTPLALHGERLKAGDTVHLAVCNTGPEPLFAWIFDVGVSGRSSVLSKAARSGYALGAAGAEDDRFELWGAEGVALYWPPDVPTDAEPAERPETFVVLVADRRADLSSLSPPAGAARGAPGSALEAMIAEARPGCAKHRPRGAPTTRCGTGWRRWSSSSPRPDRSERSLVHVRSVRQVEAGDRAPMN